MFCILPPGVTENDPINRLSALLAAVGQELLQNHSYTPNRTVFGTFPILMIQRDEGNVGKSHYFLCFVVSPKGINCFPFFGNHDLF